MTDIEMRKTSINGYAWECPVCGKNFATPTKTQLKNWAQNHLMTHTEE